MTVRGNRDRRNYVPTRAREDLPRFRSGAGAIRYVVALGDLRAIPLERGTRADAWGLAQTQFDRASAIWLVCRARRTLDRDDRKILNALLVKNLSPGAIADRYDVSLRTVDRWIVRALGRLNALARDLGLIEK